MFKTTINNVEYKVRFKHYYSNTTDKKGVVQRVPEKTTCVIIKGLEKVNEGTARPIKEMVMIEPSSAFAEEVWGRKLKRVYKLGDDTGVAAVIRGDQFSYEEGRKISLEKAIKTFPRAERKEFWAAFKTMGKKEKSMDIVKVAQ